MSKIITVTTLTDDLERSIAFYRDGMGLPMRLFSNAILMFPMGDAELEVCLRGHEGELVGFGLDIQSGSSGAVLTLAGFDGVSTDAVRELIDSRPDDFMEVANLANGVSFQDFNGILWRVRDAAPYMS